ncbi:hypothetical protein F0U60_01395 [Archangium minus]|uniref:Uncharacterized protein n=1 Tax=Archangium minus TaxID=83450 RepID=A0ABY9WGH5_9BACT|nr:hypothetical protein F0U61_01340 [Archangium violaceum]WNG42894.1 hypothetical protein F0U60_01395 [Archangium minus]
MTKRDSRSMWLVVAGLAVALVASAIVLHRQGSSLASLVPLFFVWVQLTVILLPLHRVPRLATKLIRQHVPPDAVRSR